MAVAEQIDLMREGVLAGVPLPYVLRLSAPMSDEELIAFSRKNRPYQIECNSEGELEIMSSPGAQGSHWEAIAISELGNWSASNGGVSFSSNGGFRLPNGSVRSPDAAWIRQQRWDELSNDERSRFAPLCPDFIMEILSATDSRKRLQGKMDMWIANGAQLS